MPAASFDTVVCTLLAVCGSLRGFAESAGAKAQHHCLRELLPRGLDGVCCYHRGARRDLGGATASPLLRRAAGRARATYDAHLGRRRETERVLLFRARLGGSQLVAHARCAFAFGPGHASAKGRLDSIYIYVLDKRDASL